MKNTNETEREIREIIIHCSATPEGRDYSVADIDRWHRARGFSRIGYHYVIYRDGSIHPGRPIREPGAHCLGHNAHSIGICYIGGLDSNGRPKDTRTPEQKTALRKLTEELNREALTKNNEPLKIWGHNRFANKACPCFRVPEEL